MKTWKEMLGGLCALTAASLVAINIPLEAQTSRARHFTVPSIIPMFTNNPAAMFVITNLLAEPPPELSVPELAPAPHRELGTYWTLTGPPAPLPFNPFASLPAYQVSTNPIFIIDTRSVDFAALNAQQEAENEALGLTNQTLNSCPYCNLDLNSLWIQVPSNSLAVPGYFAVNVMSTIEGQSYNILTTPSLPASWATELTVTGAVGNLTPVQLPMNGRTNLFVWARTSVAYSFYIAAPPLSQTVEDGDMVTFSANTGGNTNLTFQWTFNGFAIPGATNSSYTIYNVQDSEAGFYACIVSDGTNSLLTPAAQLATDSQNPVGPAQTGDFNLIPVLSARQSYNFRSGFTYYINQSIALYGETTISAGAILKFDDDNSTNSSLLVMGGLDCKGEPYNPCILTSVDDDSAGEWVSAYSTGSPQTATNGTPYLDLTCAQSNQLNNLRVCFANWGATTPVVSRKLDVWDCQFVACNYGVVNLVAGNSTNSLHNVLFADCQAGIAASTNAITIQGEQVTAAVADFCLASATPSAIALTNSIVFGNTLSAATLTTANVAINPERRNFQHVGEGHYYLAPNSVLHGAGTASISPRLQAEFQNKTTYPPLAVAANTQISGAFTFAPQAPRYTNGVADLGFYYDALDYTVAALTLSGGSLNVLPGTAIGVRNEYIWNAGYWTSYGIYVNQGGSITSHGTPTKPNVFTSADLVQEKPNINFAEYQIEIAYYYGDWLPGIATVVTDFELNDQSSPTLDFRFSNFYLPTADLHVCSGLSYDGFWIFSSDSTVYLNLQDCSLHNGQVNLGQPDGYDFASDQVFGSGAVTFKNNLFENVNINLDPTFYEYGDDDQGLNVDLSFQGYNNLFRGGQWFHLEPIPASAGDWVFEDNVFDKVNIVQDINSGQNQPLDYDYNGYWPLSTNALTWNSYFYTWYWLQNSSELMPTVTTNGFTDGQNEVTLNSTPPYQNGPFGRYYLPNTTLLYGAGSDTAANLGLFHYTTRVDQVKEGNDTSKAMVNIGLHYIAANTFGQAMDTDGDGIPDYVEDANGNGIVDANETDWQNSMTDGFTPDASNSVYLNIDLSGDGLVGRVKAGLGMTPLDPSNPLTLKQIITGEEPDIATFEVPLNYNLLTNIGNLNLYLNGVDVEFEDCGNAADGNTLLTWNTTYQSPGKDYLQAQFTINNAGDDTAVLTGAGTIAPFNSTNKIIFFEGDSLFDTNGAYLDAQLPAQYAGQNVSYTIQLNDPFTTPSTPLQTITNTTSSGMIQDNWNLIESDGATVFSGSTMTATFNVTFPDNSSGKNTKTLNKVVTTELIGDHDGFDFAYMYMPTTGDLGLDYGDFFGDPGYIWLAMLDPVDNLLTPQEVWGGSPFYFNSSFDTCDSENFPGQPGDPGYCAGRYDITNSINGLYGSMADGTTKNFYCKAHGNAVRLASYVPSATNTPSCYIDANEVANLLGNHYYPRNGKNGGLRVTNPYRFVFLDGCSTESVTWRRAFGIMPIWAASQSAIYNLGPQAFVAWETTNTCWPGGAYTTNGLDYNESINWATAYARNLANDFYYNWLTGGTVASCISTASYPQDGSAPLPVPYYKNHGFTLSGNDFLGPYTYARKNMTWTSQIYVVGHSGLKRTSYDPTQDNYYHDPADHP